MLGHSRQPSTPPDTQCLFPVHASQLRQVNDSSMQLQQLWGPAAALSSRSSRSSAGLQGGAPLAVGSCTAPVPCPTSVPVPEPAVAQLAAAPAPEPVAAAAAGTLDPSEVVTAVGDLDWGRPSSSNLWPPPPSGDSALHHRKHHHAPCALPPTGHLPRSATPPLTELKLRGSSPPFAHGPLHPSKAPLLPPGPASSCSLTLGLASGCPLLPGPSSSCSPPPGPASQGHQSASAYTTGHSPGCSPPLTPPPQALPLKTPTPDSATRPSALQRLRLGRSLSLPFLPALAALVIRTGRGGGSSPSGKGDQEQEPMQQGGRCTGEGRGGGARDPGVLPAAGPAPPSFYKSPFQTVQDRPGAGCCALAPSQHR